MMDEKKVRKAIERIKQDIHVLEERKEYDEYGQQTLDIAIEHYNTAIEELEKWLPKKVDAKEEYKTFDEDFMYFKGFCPDCGFIVDSSRNRYCPSCGQKLDWSE